MQTPYFTDEELEKLSNYLFENAEKLVYEECTETRPYYPDREDLASYKWLIVEVQGLGEIHRYVTGVSHVLKVEQDTTINHITEEQSRKHNFSKAFSEIYKFRRKKGLEEGAKDKDIFFKNL